MERSPTHPFINRILPAPKGGGFRMDGYWVWCGSVIRGDDGRYQMFASRWPRDVSFAPNWLTNSEVVRTVSDTPAGPYEFVEVVLPQRGRCYWDGLMTHNPTIHRFEDEYLLFYTGTNYSFPTPGPGVELSELQWKEARRKQAIGLATAPSVEGPWERRNLPILEPRPGKWDGLITTNPAACVHADGSVLLAYKSTAHDDDLLRLGVARAPRAEGPYERLSDEPLFDFGRDEQGTPTSRHAEDPYIWWSGECYEMVAKDMNGKICGEPGAGLHGVSYDGAVWEVADPPKALSRTVAWDDGTETTFAHVERPQVLIEDGTPTHLFCAVGNAVGDMRGMTETWNIAIPLKT